MKVLLTAFKPFNKNDINLSSKVLEELNEFDTTILDVVYDEVYLELNKTHNLSDYDLIIALGEARMRDELTLELQAKNVSSCSLADNKNNLKQNEVIINSGNEVIKTQVDIRNLEEVVKFSYDAGKFVCNNLYYHLLYNYPQKSLFIHIPNCSSDEYVVYADKIRNIIEIIKRNRGV